MTRVSAGRVKSLVDKVNQTIIKDEFEIEVGEASDYLIVFVPTTRRFKRMADVRNLLPDTSFASSFAACCHETHASISMLYIYTSCSNL
jgi:hypothetical protein